MTTVTYPLAVPLVFLWVGFVCAISFMEAWLKFRAPGVTVPLGLGIGRIIFRALNRIEWVLAVAVGLNLLPAGRAGVLVPANILFAVPLMLLIVQTFWLLPALNARATALIQGKPVPLSALHICFIGFEAVKVICLILFGITLFTYSSI